MKKKFKVRVEDVNASNAHVAGVTTLDGNRYVKFAGDGQSLYVSSVDMLTDKQKVRRILAEASFILPSKNELAAYLSAAEDISPRTSNGRNTLSSCFRISLLPNPRARPACPS